MCQPVSWLTSLLILGEYGNISCSAWDIFLKLYGDIPHIFLHYCQIISNFLYVCQSDSWLTFLLILDKYKDSSSFGWYTFLKSFGDIPGIFLQLFLTFSHFLYICQSISWLPFLLKSDKYRDISSSQWYIFLTHFGDNPWMLVQ